MNIIIIRTYTKARQNADAKIDADLCALPYIRMNDTEKTGDSSAKGVFQMNRRTVGVHTVGCVKECQNETESVMVCTCR